MAFAKGHKPAHTGKMITTEPIRTLDTVALIRKHLIGHIRDAALFSVALNSALRAGDLCRLQWSDVEDDGEYIILRVIERKTMKTKLVPLNASASADLRRWKSLCTSQFIYSGQRGPLTVASYSRIVKSWCAAAGMTEHVASHTMRKSFVRLQHDHFGTSITTLMVMLNHSHPSQTVRYMGKMTADVQAAYENTL